MGSEAFNPFLFLRQCMRAGTYKIPTANDIPLDLRVTLLRDAPCRRTPQVGIFNQEIGDFCPCGSFVSPAGQERGHVMTILLIHCWYSHFLITSLEECGNVQIDSHLWVPGEVI